MSKSNVNPNHYKIAGRERQSEDIVQVRYRQKHAQSLVRVRSGRHARFPHPVSVFGPSGAGAARKRTARKATANQQGAGKRGKRSTAQERAPSRHDFEPVSATSPVAAAIDKEPSSRGRRVPKR